MIERKMWMLSQEMLSSLSCGQYLSHVLRISAHELDLSFFLPSLSLLPLSSQLYLIYRHRPPFLPFPTFTTMVPGLLGALMTHLCDLKYNTLSVNSDPSRTPAAHRALQPCPVPESLHLPSRLTTMAISLFLAWLNFYSEVE